MWIKDEKAPTGMFLILTFVLMIASSTACNLLTDYSVAYEATGQMTAGYLVYAAIGLLFSTPGPAIALFITLRKKEKISVKEYLRRFLATPRPLYSAVLTAAFCATALVFALINGLANGSPWYMLPLGFVIMLPFVGFAEETGWRGFLQPALEKKLRYPFSVLLTTVIWIVWHADMFIDPTSHHFGDSIPGFVIGFVIWAFALAALYKATKSVLACAVYHSFVNAIGAVFDWNLLFDAFPGNTVTLIYRVLLLSFSVFLWLYSDRKEPERSAMKITRRN